MTSDIRPGRPGGLRFILLRYVALIALTLPALLAARQAMTSGPGRDPRVAAAGLDATTSMVTSMLRAGAPGLGTLLAVGGLLFLLFDQLLTAAALIQLEPRKDDGRPVRVWRTVWDEGWRYLPRFLRLVLLGAVVTGVGSALLSMPFDRFAGVAIREGWTGSKSLLVTSGAPAVASLVWFFLVGALTRWARVLMVADRRHRVRRAWSLAAIVAWKTPLRTALYFVLVPLLVQLAGGALIGLAATRLRSPLLGQAPLIAAWLGYLLVVCLVWYLLLHRARLLIGTDRFDRLRSTGDEPFWAAHRARRKRRNSKSRRVQSLQLNLDERSPGPHSDPTPVIEPSTPDAADLELELGPDEIQPDR